MNDIRLIQMSNYIKPKLEENKSKNWVLNGVNNSFYKYVIDRYNGSVTNSSVINSYCDLIYGQGIHAKDSHLKLTQWASFLSIIKPKELKKIISDYKLFGEASMQVIKTKDKKGVASILHLPKQFVVPCLENEDGEITTYWYSKDFSSSKIKPIPFPAFGTSDENIEIYVIKPYKAGKNYFSDPDYLSGLPYAEMEEEMSNFFINSIKKGLSAGYIINVPDGQTLTPDEKDTLESKIKAKLTGSPNAMGFVLSFNGKDAEITIVPIPVNDNQHKQWEFLSNESRQQIMTAHRVVSPKLFGIMADGGLGNNANELDEAEAQLMKRVIQPYQIAIIEALEDILSVNGITLNLYFKALSEKTSVQNPINMSSDNFLDGFGEKISSEDYDLIFENEVDYEEEDSVQFASTGFARPNLKSSQDGKDFIVRYKYFGNTNPQRPFCQKMMSAGKVYRKEDIIAMENMSVNPGWGPEGIDKYSVWLYKGGGNCHHKWFRQIYLKKGVKVDVNSPLAELISTSEARKKGLKLETNDTLVSVEPRYMINNGFLKAR
jgi:hypothetical protein